MASIETNWPRKMLSSWAPRRIEDSRSPKREVTFCGNAILYHRSSTSVKAGHRRVFDDAHGGSRSQAGTHSRQRGSHRASVEHYRQAFVLFRPANVGTKCTDRESLETWRPTRTLNRSGGRVELQT